MQDVYCVFTELPCAAFDSGRLTGIKGGVKPWLLREFVFLFLVAKALVGLCQQFCEHHVYQKGIGVIHLNESNNANNDNNNNNNNNNNNKNNNMDECVDR